MLAPVALFVYNRLDNTRRTIEALLANHMASETPVYVFSDGGKDEKSWADVRRLREYLHTVTGFGQFIVIERTENYYIERNTTEGIAEVLSRHDRIIVLEDDLVTSPWFLTYMNEALDKYRDDERVWHVAGFTNLDVPELGDTYFCHHMSGTGWGTWRDRWAHFVHFTSREQALSRLTDAQKERMEMRGHFPCFKSLDKDPIPWDVCWDIAINQADALCLHPTHTLVRNIGLATGTHTNQMSLFGWYEYDREPLGRRVTLRDIPVEVTPGIEARYEVAMHDHGIRYNLLGRVARWVLHNVIRRLRKA
ncbi:MAG: glycosyltransferase [Bacteroidaceae bacterium]|nr:glycosyltransferase [Bacteroidaceae bacterium]